MKAAHRSKAKAKLAKPKAAKPERKGQLYEQEEEWIGADCHLAGERMEGRYLDSREGAGASPSSEKTL